MKQTIFRPMRPLAEALASPFLDEAPGYDPGPYDLEHPARPQKRIRPLTTSRHWWIMEPIYLPMGASRPAPFSSSFRHHVESATMNTVMTIWFAIFCTMIR